MTENNSLEATETNVAVSEPTEDVKEVEQGSQEPTENEVDNGEEQDADEPEVELSADALEFKEKLEKTKAAMQKRIDRQTAANRQRDEEISQLRKQIEGMNVPQDDSPKEEDFASYEEYMKAVGKHEAKKELEAQQREQLEAQRAAKEQEARAAKEKQYNERVEAFKAEKPDYAEKESLVEEVVGEAMRNGVTPTIQLMAEAVLESEAGARIVYELGENPDLLENLLTMSPYQAVRELVKLEGKPVDIVKEKPLPKPIKNNSGSTKAQKSVTRMSSEEFKKQWLS